MPLPELRLAVDPLVAEPLDELKRVLQPEADLESNPAEQVVGGPEAERLHRLVGGDHLEPGVAGRPHVLLHELEVGQDDGRVNRQVAGDTRDVGHRLGRLGAAGPEEAGHLVDPGCERLGARVLDMTTKPRSPLFTAIRPRVPPCRW